MRNFNKIFRLSALKFNAEVVYNELVSKNIASFLVNKGA